MVAIRIQLHCDTEGCKTFFPAEGPADGAIYSLHDLRLAAREHGWARQGSPRRDVCPDCCGKQAMMPRKARPAATSKVNGSRWHFGA